MVVCFSASAAFGKSIQTLQCQATMLNIQCFSLEFQFQFPAWEEFEAHQLGSLLAYKDTKYLI